MRQPNTKKQFSILGMCAALWIITLLIADSYYPGQIERLLLISVIVAILFTAWAISIVSEFADWFLSTEDE